MVAVLKRILRIGWRMLMAVSMASPWKSPYFSSSEDHFEIQTEESMLDRVQR